MLLKQRGFADFPNTIGFSLPPAAFTKNAHVILSLDCLPPLHCFAGSERDFFGNARKNVPVVGAVTCEYYW